ncbi:MAG: PD-(D/E)XK motif protein [Anaerolineae bacterium]|nr:PD-(D/E)XK motif protein [Anaerolineae bacterium]
MITFEEVERTWHLLDASALASDGLTVREIEAVQMPHGHPLFALDSNSQRHLLIPLKSDIHIVEDKQSAGVHLLANQWVDGETKRIFADLVCLKPHLNRLFDLILTEILNSLQSDVGQPDRVIRHVLTRWRELINKEPINRLSPSEIIGLFGELWQLREMIRFDPNTVSLWVGPHGARHDFYNGKTALEVKTTTQRVGRVITIHGHEQLEKPPEGNLYLAVLRLEQLPAGGETAAELIENLVELGCDRLAILSTLAKQNMTWESIAQCSDIHLRAVENRIYPIDQDFPRITSASFKGDAVPNGILALEYQIDLIAEPPFPLPQHEISPFYQKFVNEVLR